MQTKKIFILACTGGFLETYDNNGGRLERTVVTDPMKAKVFDSVEEMSVVRKLFKDCEGRQYEIVTQALGGFLSREEMDHFDLVNSIRIRQSLDDHTRQFITRSEVWKAIVDHVSKAKFCYIIERLPDYVQEHRGTGASISYKDSWIYVGELIKNKVNHISVSLSVSYYDKEDVDDGIENPREYMKEHTIVIPFELFEKFTKKGFDAWISRLKEKAGTDLPEKEHKQLRSLMLKYPEGARALIEHLKKEGKIE